MNADGKLQLVTETDSRGGFTDQGDETDGALDEFEIGKFDIVIVFIFS